MAMLRIYLLFLAVCASIFSKICLKTFGPRARLPSQLNRTPSLISSFICTLKKEAYSLIKYVTSKVGLDQFSVEKPQSVKILTPKLREPRTTFIAVSSPFLWPSIGESPCFLAQRLLPSGIITTGLGGFFFTVC